MCLCLCVVCLCLCLSVCMMQCRRDAWAGALCLFGRPWTCHAVWPLVVSQCAAVPDDDNSAWVTLSGIEGCDLVTPVTDASGKCVAACSIACFRAPLTEADVNVCSVITSLNGAGPFRVKPVWRKVTSSDGKVRNVIDLYASPHAPMFTRLFVLCIPIEALSFPSSLLLLLPALFGFSSEAWMRLVLTVWCACVRLAAGTRCSWRACHL